MDVFVASLLSFIPRLSLGALNIKAVQRISRRELLLLKRLRTVNIVDKHCVSHELGWLWRHVGEFGESVDGVQRVGGLSCGLELDDLSFSALNILIHQIELRFVVQTHVEHAWARPHDILVDQIEFGPFYFILGPNAGLCT